MTGLPSGEEPLRLPSFHYRLSLQLNRKQCLQSSVDDVYFCVFIAVHYSLLTDYPHMFTTTSDAVASVVEQSFGTVTTFIVVGVYVSTTDGWLLYERSQGRHAARGKTEGRELGELPLWVSRSP